MTVLQVLNFGGEVPSSSARTLPPGSARVARNLHPRVSEFRPLNEALDMAGVTVASGSKALHRLERKADGTFASDLTTGWLAYPQERSFARGQINDDLTGRVYYSFDDGSAPPRVMDAGINPARDGMAVRAAVDKPLGIPPPPKPVVTALIGGDFPPEAYTYLINFKTAEIARNVRANVRFGLIGYDMAGAGIPGFINKTITGVVATATTTGGSTTLVTDPNNPGGTLIPSTSTTGGTNTMTTDDFVIGGTTPGTPIATVTLLEIVNLTAAHRVGFGPVGLVAYIPTLDGGQTDFVALYNYRTFNWQAPNSASAFTYDRVQFEDWLRIPGNSEYE